MYDLKDYSVPVTTKYTDEIFLNFICCDISFSFSIKILVIVCLYWWENCELIFCYTAYLYIYRDSKLLMLPGNTTDREKLLTVSESTCTLWFFLKFHELENRSQICWSIFKALWFILMNLSKMFDISTYRNSISI